MTSRFMLRTFAVFSLPLLAGCASMKNTPAQDLALEQMQRCGHLSSMLSPVNMNDQAFDACVRKVREERAQR